MVRLIKFVSAIVLNGPRALHTHLVHPRTLVRLRLTISRETPCARLPDY